MELRELLGRFRAGVVYDCGCEECGIHPAIVKALEAGRLSADHLLICPEHGAPLADVAARPAVEPPSPRPA